MEILTIISPIASTIAVVLSIIFKKSAQVYVDEKAKNLATLEDTAKITQEIESVKSQYSQKSHAWKWVFEKEYEILNEVWKSTWEFQFAARSLRPIMEFLPQDNADKKEVFRTRRQLYNNSVVNFRDIVLKNKPFIPASVYDTCISLREIVIDLKVDFEITFNNEQPEPNWQKLHEKGKQLDKKLEELNEQIRAHIHGKT